MFAANRTPGRRLLPPAVIILSAALPGQALPDPLALAATMQPAAPVTAGRPLALTDGRTGAPLAGAALVLFGHADISPEVYDAMRILRRSYADDPVLGSLAEAVRFGRKWVTDDAGRAVIPADFRGRVHIVKGDLHDQESVGESYEPEVTVYPRTWVEAALVHADGTPAAGVEVGLRSGGHEVRTASGFAVRASTDARGVVRVELPQYTMRESWGLPLVLQAAICGADDATGLALDPARWRRGDPGSVRLQLPDVGRLRLSGVDGSGLPRPFTLGYVTSVGGPPDQLPGIVNVDVDGAAQCTCLVATGRQFHVAMSFPHQLGAEHLVVAGPRRGGEVVDAVVDARVAPHLLTVRIALPDGRPLDRGRVWCQELWSPVEPDAAGRIRIAPTPQQAASLTRLTLSVQDRQRSLGAVSVTAPQQPGLVDLGRAVLAEEPVLLEGRVLDAQGRPVPGAEVHRRVANHICEFPAPATTDAEGRFTLRLLNPQAQQVWVTANHRLHGFWPPGTPGLTDVPGFDVGATDVEIVLQALAK
jgi:hypothetical protein